MLDKSQELNASAGNQPPIGTSSDAFEFEFPYGLIGFQGDHRYVLMVPPQNISSPHYVFLKSLDTPGLCFILVPFDPQSMPIDHKDLEKVFSELSIASPAARVFLIATPQRQERHIHVHVNLRAPIVLDIYAQQGWQYVFQNQDYPLQHMLDQAPMLV